MSEKYSLEWFLDRLDSRDFKDIDWASLGQLSINAMIRKNGGTVNEDLEYAKADARHWHTGYQKTQEELNDIYRELRIAREEEARATRSQEEQRNRADAAEKKLNEVVGARKGDTTYIQNLEKLNVELEEDVKAYKDYIAILEEQVSNLKDWINEFDKPLASNHPALVEAEKAGYERGWNAAREELNTVSSENRDIFEELKAITKERDDYINDVARLKTILEETREEQTNNIRIYSGYIHDRDDIIQDLTNKKNEWKNLTLECIRDILDEAIDKGYSL